MSTAGNPLASLIVRFIADASPFVSGVQQAQDKVQSFSDNFISVTKNLAAAAPFAALGIEAFHSAEEFDSASALIARSTGATGEKLGELEGSFKSLFQQTTISAAELATGLGLISKETGATGADLEALTLVNANLAKVTGQSLTPSIEGTQQALKQFGITAAEQPAALDALFTLTQKTGISIAALSSGLQSAGPVLKTLGLNFDQSAALLANFQEKGVSTDKVVAALNKGLVTLAGEGIKQPEVAMGNFIQRLIDAKSPLDAVELSAQTFGKRGGLFFADAARQGAFDITDLTKAAQDSTGNINKTAESTKTLSDGLTQMAHAADVALLPLGKPLVTALEGAVAEIAPLIKLVGDLGGKFEESHPKILEYTALIIGVGAAAGIAAKGVKLFFDLIGGSALLGGIGAIAGAFTNIKVAILSDLIPALTLAETALLGLGTAGVGAAIVALLGPMVEFDHATDHTAETMGRLSENLRAAGKLPPIIPDATVGNIAEFILNMDQAAASTAHVATVAGPTAQEIKKAFADLGLKDIPLAIADINKSFAIVSASGVLTASQLRSAFEDAQLKIVTLRDSISKAPLKALGIDTTELDVAKKALELINQDVLTGHASMDELAQAQENYTKKVQASEAGLNRIEVALNKAGAAGQLLNFDSLTQNVTVAQQVVASLAASLDPAKESVDAAAKLVTTLGDNLQKVGPAAAPLREALREVQLQMLAIQSTTLFQNDPFVPVRTSVDALVEHLNQLQATSLSVEATLHELGQKTPSEVANGIAQIQDAIAKMNAAVAIGIPGALQAVQDLYRQLTAAEITALNAKPFHDFGVTSNAELQILAVQAAKNFKDIQDPVGVTTTDIARSWVAMIQQMEQRGAVFSADTELQVLKTQRQLSDTAKAAVDAIDSQVKTAMHDISSTIAQAIVEGKAWGDSFVTLGQKIGEQIIEGVINKALKGTIDSIDSLIVKFAQWIGLISDAGNAAAKAGTQAASIATPPFSTTSGIPGLGGSDPGGLPGVDGLPGTDLAGGGAASAAGSAASGVLGLVNVVTGAVTAISSVIGNFQMAREEGTLNAIEQHTKVTAIALAGIAAPWEQVPQGQATIAAALNQSSVLMQNFDTWKDSTLLPAIQSITDTLTKVLKPIFLDMDAVLHVLMIPGVAGTVAAGGDVTSAQAAALLSYSTFSNTQITSGLGELSTSLDDLKSAIVGSIITDGIQTRAQIVGSANTLGSKIDGVTNGIRDKLDQVFRPFGAISDVLNSIGGGISGILGGIGSAAGGIGGGLISGVLSAFGVGQGGEKDRLSIIANDTSYLAWVFDAGGGHVALLDIQNGLSNLTDAFTNWFRDDVNQLISIVTDIRNIQSSNTGGGLASVTGNVIFNINPAAGSDPNAIADAIARKLKLRSSVFA